MQREIKFKVWDKVTKKMLVNYNLFTFESNFGGIKEEDIEICQYTGLKDKNGKEIYEGDILFTTIKLDDKFGEKPVYYLVKFTKIEDCCVGGNGFVIEQSDFYFQAFDFEGNLQAKIVGNIYENPDLLS